MRPLQATPDCQPELVGSGVPRASVPPDFPLAALAYLQIRFQRALQLFLRQRQPCKAGNIGRYECRIGRMDGTPKIGTNQRGVPVLLERRAIVPLFLRHKSNHSFVPKHHCRVQGGPPVVVPRDGGIGPCPRFQQLFQHIRSNTLVNCIQCSALLRAFGWG